RGTLAGLHRSELGQALLGKGLESGSPLCEVDLGLASQCDVGDALLDLDQLGLPGAPWPEALPNREANGVEQSVLLVRWGRRGILGAQGGRRQQGGGDQQGERGKSSWWVHGGAPRLGCQRTAARNRLTIAGGDGRALRNRVQGT